jgi:uncharacterized membrane protein YfcA
VLILGGIVAALVALLAGTSGFGFGLVATPVLLLAGFSLPFVVTVNLLISLATRVSVAWRLRHAISTRRVTLLLAGAVPGLWVGARTLGALDAHEVKIAVGILIMAAAGSIAWVDRHPPRPRLRGLVPLAGFLGGVLGTTTSLIGVPPALLLTRRRLATESFFADLSVYFIASAAVGLALLHWNGKFDPDAARAFAWWLPGVLVANVVGTTLGLRVPDRAFRALTLGLAFGAGALTVLTA